MVPQIGVGYVPLPRNFTIENKFSSKDFLAIRHRRISPTTSSLVSSTFYGIPEGTRTPDTLLRTEVLYPSELPGHKKALDSILRRLADELPGRSSL